jgi:hypothetical protein
MSLALYMDEHVPRKITEGLRQRRVDVLTIQEDNRVGFPDAALLDRATELERVMFSRDQDFLIEASRRQAEGTVFSGVIYAHQMLVSIGKCVQDLEIIAKACSPKELANRVLYLPL